MLEQHIGNSAGGGTGVYTSSSRDVYGVENIERTGKFMPCSRGVLWARYGQANSVVVTNFGGWLQDFLVVHKNLPGVNIAGCRGTRSGQIASHKGLIEAFHVRHLLDRALLEHSVIP